MKIRNLENGKFYKSKNSMKFGARQSEIRKKACSSEEMRKLAEKSHSPELDQARSKKMKQYYKDRPGLFSKRIKQAYEDQPELRKVRAEAMKVNRTVMGEYNTDPENIERRRTHRNGKQVIKIVKMPRIPSTGVVVSECTY